MASEKGCRAKHGLICHTKGQPNDKHMLIMNIKTVISAELDQSCEADSKQVINCRIVYIEIMASFQQNIQNNLFLSARM